MANTFAKIETPNSSITLTAMIGGKTTLIILDREQSNFSSIVLNADELRLLAIALMERPDITSTGVEQSRVIPTFG